MSSGTKPRTLSDVLIEKQIITDEQLRQAERRRTESGCSLEQALMDLGILSEGDLLDIYNDAFQVRFLKLEDVEIDREAVRHVPAAVAHKHHLIPVRRSGNVLAVAMADPSNAEALEALHNVTDFDLIPFVARYDAIEHAIYVHYGEAAENADTVSESTEAATPLRVTSLIEDDRVGHIGRSVQLHRDQTFEAFVEDGANQFPLSIARSIAGLQAEEGYNPFHCWGPEGSGKSHLLQAIANHLTTHSPLKRFILTTGERFVDHLFESIRDRKLNFFRYLNRELDVLIIDDAEPLMSRDWAQRELVETFHHLQRRGKRLVVSAGRNLAAEPRILPDLRKVFESGVICGFGKYSEAAKLEIVKARTRGIALPADIMTQLVRCGGEGLQDLLGLLQQVAVLAALGEREITAEVVEDLARLCGSSAESPAERARLLGAATAAQSREHQA
jgi:chromosomal replication initiation ATPase DnaA